MIFRGSFESVFVLWRYIKLEVAVSVEIRLRDCSGIANAAEVIILYSFTPRIFD